MSLVHARSLRPREHGRSKEERRRPQSQGARHKRHRREAEGGQHEAAAAGRQDGSAAENHAHLRQVRGDLLPAELPQIRQPAGLVQLRPRLHRSSLGLLDHEQQQQHGDQAEARGHLVEDKHRHSQRRQTPDDELQNQKPANDTPELTRKAECQLCAAALT